MVPGSILLIGRMLPWERAVQSPSQQQTIFILALLPGPIRLTSVANIMEVGLCSILLMGELIRGVFQSNRVLSYRLVMADAYRNDYADTQREQEEKDEESLFGSCYVQLVAEQC